jgi:hypothetical protein
MSTKKQKRGQARESKKGVRQERERREKKNCILCDFGGEIYQKK